MKNFVTTATEAVKSIQLLVEDPDLREAFKAVNRLVNKPQLHSTVDSLDLTVKKLNGAIDDIDRLAVDLSGSTQNLTADTQQTFVVARDALREIASTTSSLRNVVQSDSPAMHELSIALKEISGAARSLRLMADYLERNPRALLFGKPGDGDRR